MHAIVVSHPGGPEVLEYQEVPTPPVKPGWTRVKVRGFGINHSEVFTREGESPSVHFPRILGIEAVGTIDETSAPDQFSVGQTVVSLMGEMGRDYDGGYAEYVLLPNDQIYPIHTKLDWASLAAIPETFYTAFGIYRSLQLKDSDRVLITGASSGVGIATLKLIKASGFNVSIAGTTRSSHKTAILTELGFNRIIQTPDANVLPADAGEFDKIVDLIGSSALLNTLTHLAEFGILNSTGELGGVWAIENFEPVMDIPNNRYLTSFSSAEVTKERVQEMFDFIEDHHIDVTPVKVFSLNETRQAHEYLAESNGYGKVVVLP